MEVKINREIRDYTESMFFGLSMRQFFFSIAALGIAVLIYMTLKPVLGTETVSWMCILGAAPFAAMGFIKYNGMPAEQFAWAFIRSELIEPRELTFQPDNLYMDMLDEIEAEKEMQGNKKVKERKKHGNGNAEEAVKV